MMVPETESNNALQVTILKGFSGVICFIYSQIYSLLEKLPLIQVIFCPQRAMPVTAYLPPANGIWVHHFFAHHCKSLRREIYAEIELAQD